MKLTKEQKKEFKQYLSDKLGVDLKDVKSKSHFVYNLGVDSLDFVEIIMDCEVKYNVSIRDDEAEKSLKVGKFIKLIEKSKKN